MIFIGVVVVLLVIFTIFIHNKIISQHNHVEQSWHNVVTQERQKTQILPRIETWVKDHKEFESSTLIDVTKMRSAYSQLEGDSSQVPMADLKSAMAASHSLMNGLQLTVEDYPELKSEELYRNLITEITEQEEMVGASLRIYNSNTAIFNTTIEVFPNNLVNQLVTKKKKIELFQNDEAEQALGFSPNF